MVLRRTSGGSDRRLHGQSCKKPARPRRKKGAASIKGLTAAEVTSDTPPAAIEDLGQAVRDSGGGVVGSYRDPVGGHWHLVASLPIEKVEPTPFQRDISKTHVERLSDVIGRMGRFLDPIIAVRTAFPSFPWHIKSSP